MQDPQALSSALSEAGARRARLASLLGPLLAIASATLVCFGCSPADEPLPQGETGVGGAAATLVVEPGVYLPASMELSLLEPRGDIPLWWAPQGGQVLLIGAHIHGLDSDTIELSARLRELTGGALIAEALRTVRVQPLLGRQGWSTTDPRAVDHVTHLATCPDPGSRAMAGVEVSLEVQVVELYSDFSQGSVALPVVPRCPPNDTLCACECATGYLPGGCP